MALEDRIERLTVVIEKWITMISLARVPEPAPAEDADPVEGNVLLGAGTNATYVLAPEPETPVRRRRGRPPVEPVAPETSADAEAPADEISPDEEAPEAAVSGPVADVSKKLVIEAVMKVKAVIGTKAAKAVVSSVGLTLLADIQTRPELRAALYTAAIKALDDFENEV